MRRGDPVSGYLTSCRDGDAARKSWGERARSLEDYSGCPVKIDRSLYAHTLTQKSKEMTWNEKELSKHILKDKKPTPVDG